MKRNHLTSEVRWFNEYERREEAMTYGEQVREACAQIAIAYASDETRLHANPAVQANTANAIAGEIRKMPLPEAPNDEPDALATFICEFTDADQDWSPESLAIAILAAGWRRSP